MNKLKLINPFTDFGFKRIFNQEINKILLIDFLNQLLKGEREVADVVFLNNEIQPEYQAGRLVIFDVHCKSTDGTEFIVEMQLARQSNFYDRGLYYQCRAFAAQGQKGDDWNYEIHPIYGIFFLNFKMNDLSKLRTDVVLADRETGKPFNEKFRQIYLELPRFTKEAEECENDFERWLYLLKNMEILERMPFKAQRAVWEKLINVASVSALNQQERATYEQALKNYRDYNNTISTAWEDGEAIGLEKGLKKGRAEGLIEGERNKQLQIARQMKTKGLSVDIISVCTGLTAEEIAAL